MRVCDWIADYLYNRGTTRIHGLMGGGASGLNDGFIKHGKINYICYHHEQGAGHAAIGEAKYTGKIAVVNPTTGCAGTNCATSVLNAWQDSTPVLFLSGNVRLSTCSGWINNEHNLNLRKYGVQEHHIVDTYRSMCKFVEFVTKPEDVPYALERALFIAESGRPGPVWIDIPSDIQTAPMPNLYQKFVPPLDDEYLFETTQLKDRLITSERPVILAGYGIRQSGCVDQFVEFIENYQLPYASTYGARDYTSYDHPLSLGTVGIKGSRVGNFAMQNADLLLILGSSLNSSVVGYDPKQFSPASYKIYVDIDSNELDKNIIPVDQKIHSSLENFFEVMQ